MRKRLISVFAFALAVSAGAAFVLYQLIASKVKVGAAPPPSTVKVFVAARDLDLGAMVQDRDVRAVDYLSPPAGAITKKEDIVGRGVASPIHQDSPFFEAALAPKGGGAGFAATIPKGMRAFAVHVNEVAGVSGFAVPGMRVDVLVSGTIPGSTENVGSVTRTLLQNVEVLSAGQNFQKDAEGKPVLVQVVNLLVTPEQAEMLNLATETRIQLVLRNPSDHEIVATPGASSAGIFYGAPSRMPSMAGLQRPPAARIAASSPARVALPPAKDTAVPASAEAPAGKKPEKVTIEVFAGDKRTESTFENPENGARRAGFTGISK